MLPVDWLADSGCGGREEPAGSIDASLERCEASLSVADSMTSRAAADCLERLSSGLLTLYQLCLAFILVNIKVLGQQCYGLTVAQQGDTAGETHGMATARHKQMPCAWHAYRGTLCTFGARNKSGAGRNIGIGCWPLLVSTPVSECLAFAASTFLALAAPLRCLLPGDGGCGNGREKGFVKGLGTPVRNSVCGLNLCLAARFDNKHNRCLHANMKASCSMQARSN